MECEEVSARIWEYLDRELGSEETKLVAAHLQECRRCRPAYRCGRALLDLLARQRHACGAPGTLVVRMRRFVDL